MTEADTQTDIWADLHANTGKRGIVWAAYYLVTHPGYLAVVMHRLTHFFYGLGIPGKIISKIFWRLNVLLTQCQIRPDARIAPGLRLPHGCGVIIANNTIVGRNVTLFQHVTLGRRDPDIPEFPTIGDNVRIYAGASVLGPVRIGNGATVAAHSLVIRDVPDGALVAGVPARIIRQADDITP